MILIVRIVRISLFQYPSTERELVKYVALLAFNKIVISHSQVVARHQDIIMSCIEDPDVSIRLLALDLGSGMVNSENIVSVVDRLMQQLRDAPYHGVQDLVKYRDGRLSGPEPAADSEGEDPEETLHVYKPAINDIPPMLDEYRITIIRHILDMCSRDTYAYLTDFEWYITVLVDLVRLVPSSSRVTETETVGYDTSSLQDLEESQISSAIGSELRNVAVRVGAVRTDAVRAADSLVATQIGQSTDLALGIGNQGVLQYAAWIVGEYAELLSSKHDTLNSLLFPTLQTLCAGVICAYIQAIPKVLVEIFRSYEHSWSSQTKSMASLLLARVIHLLEPCTTHPNLEVQERSVEFLELMRLAAEAVNGHGQGNGNGPLLLSRAIPSLFNGFELNPVAVTAQRKVPVPANLDLDAPLNKTLPFLLARVDQAVSSDVEHLDAVKFYHQKPVRDTGPEPIVNKLAASIDNSFSYQYEEAASPDPVASNKKRAERREKNRDDPFYIASEEIPSGATTPFHDIIQRSNGPGVDIDSIPIMDLELGDDLGEAGPLNLDPPAKKRGQLPKVYIKSDENIGDDIETPQGDNLDSMINLRSSARKSRGKLKKSLLEVDSSGLGNFGVDEYGGSSLVDQSSFTQRELEEAEMAKALAEVERLRLEMQRASERTQIAEDVPLEGTLIKKKRKERSVKVKQERKDDKVEASRNDFATSLDPEAVVKKKKKKKKKERQTKMEGQIPES